MQAMYDLVGDRIQEIFDAQVVDIGILDEADGTRSTSRTRSRRASASTTSRSTRRVPRVVLETREPVLVET